MKVTEMEQLAPPKLLNIFSINRESYDIRSEGSIKNKQDKNRNSSQRLLPYEKQRDYLNQTMKKKYRWVTLTICVLFIVSIWFCIDYPASLEH